MKRLSFLLAIVTFSACQKAIMSSDGATSIAVAQPTRALEEFILSDDAVSYLADNDFSLWTEVESLEDRFTACDITEDKAKTMTTDAIVRSILHYPLNYIIFAYNNPIDAIVLVMEHSCLHQELLRRSDAAEILLRYFEQTEIDMTRTSPFCDESSWTVTYADEMFLEYLLASRLIKGLDKPVISEKLFAIVDSKAKKRYLDTVTYSDFSIIPLNAIKDNALFAPKQRYSAYVYTYFGQELGVESFSELSASEIVNITNQFVSQYPNAEMIRPASRTYNCHSYTWYDQSTSNHYWLNSLASDNDLQLQKYWTNDFYYLTPEANAEKVFYSSGDHSAIALSSTLYISKWGAAPLMEHAPNYCPYISTNRHYYEHRTYLPYDITSYIVGDTHITVNTIHNYSLPHHYNGMSVSWSSEPLSGIPGTCQSTMNSDGSCSFSANTPGAYYLFLEGYRNGVQLIDGNLIIIAGYY